MDTPTGNKRAKLHNFGRPKIYTDEFIENEAEEFIEWMEDPENVWFEAFATERGYSPKRFYEWVKTNKTFSDAFEIIQNIQKSKLVKGGLLKTYDSGFTKFVMANSSGWSDKHKVTTTTTSPMSEEISSIDGSSKNLVNDDSAE